MLFIKLLLFFFIFMSSTLIGILISKKYVNRVAELIEFKSFLDILKTKIRYTYEPLGEIFNDISSSFSFNISKILKETSYNMETNNAGKAWKIAIENSNININKEDKKVLLTLSKMLGETDLEGQVSQIEQTSKFLDIQIEKAENERQKNEKLYKTLGSVCGAGLIILLM